ncbi:MAG: uroporphyrinogen decarboxylase family protein [Candidatus Methylomirabilales bacterium]
MNARQRLRAALAHREPDRVPIDLGAGTTGIEVGAYEGLKRLLGVQEPTRTFVRDHVELPEQVLRRFGVDTRYVRVGAPRGYTLELAPDNSYVDIWGTRWQKPPSSLYYDMVEYPIKEATAEALQAYRWPDPHDPGRTDGLRRRAKQLAEETEFAVVLDNTGFGVFEQGWALRGFENFLADLLAEPAFAEAVINGVADYQIALYDRVLAEVGPYLDVVMVAEDLGSQAGPLISPEVYRRMIKPAQKRVWQSIKQKTEAKLFLHSCGSVRAFIPDLLEIGVDILNPVQVAAAGMDPKALKAEFGRDLTFWGGGCDTQKVLTFGTPDEVAAEVRRRIRELAPGGGFVFNQIHNIQPQVPAENIVRMLDTALEYGRYPMAA